MTNESIFTHTQMQILFTFINKRYGRFSPTPRLWSLCFQIYLFKLKSIILWYISKNNSKQYIDCDVTYPNFPAMKTSVMVGIEGRARIGGDYVN